MVAVPLALVDSTGTEKGGQDETAEMIDGSSRKIQQSELSPRFEVERGQVGSLGLC